MTMSEKGDSIDKSMKTDSEDLEIFDDCRAEMENLLANGDEETDNEVQKNPGQVGSQKQGFQKALKNKSTQSIISKNGAPAVEKQKTNLAESMSDKSNKNELDVQVIPVEQEIGIANPLHQIHQKEAEEGIEEVNENVKCFCKKYCKSDDLYMNEPRLIFRKLNKGNKGEEDIPHTIKWLEDIHRNVKRDWCDAMKTYQTEPPDKKSKKWRWLLGIKFPKKHKHELDVALLKKLQSYVEVANSEASIIENWCARIKALHIRIRASFKQLEPKHLAKLLHDKGNPEIKFEGKMGKRKMQWLLMSQKKKTLRRGRDVIMQKIRRNEELNKSEKKLINAEIDNHMWYHCPDLTECLNLSLIHI